MAVFVTSDTHFGDHRTLSIHRRPFPAVAAIDAELAARWNAAVQKDGTKPSSAIGAALPRPIAVDADQSLDQLLNSNGQLPHADSGGVKDGICDGGVHANNAELADALDA